MTGDEFVLHLFCEQYNSTMPRQLWRYSLRSIQQAALRNLVAEIEGSIWYIQKRGIGRTTLARRFCKDWNSTSHDECWFTTLTSNESARMSPSFYDIARLHLTASIDFWQNSNPFYGAAALCVTKNGNSRRRPSWSLSTLVLYYIVCHDIWYTTYLISHSVRYSISHPHTKQYEQWGLAFEPSVGQ